MTGLEKPSAPRRKHRASRARTALLLALIPGVAGIALVHWPLTAGLEQAGLDLLFQLRGKREPPGVRVVAIDDDSYWVLGVEPPGGTWPRALQAQLIRTLKREGARAVAFDIVFEGAGDPEQDAAFESALTEAGNVVLGSTVELTDDPHFRQARLIEPYPPFAAAATAVADVDLLPDREGTIRSTWLMHDDRPTLALAAYRVATGKQPPDRRSARLIDYYGPARTVPTASVYQALDPGEYLPEGFFKDKIVFVGASQPVATGPSVAKDSFKTPFSGANNPATYGVEIHATIAANLLEGREIDILPPFAEVLLLLALPMVAALAFIYLRPLIGAAVLVGLEIVPWGAGYLAFTGEQLWLPIVIPSVVQLPLAYVVSLVWYYLTTVREREKIRRAFSFYLSPEMIRKITESPGSLNLGGEEILATAMFTDIKGFTTIAEGLSAPETASLLNTYFSDVTRHVFETGGTLIKYIGDAVFAIWGAPLRMENHAAQACRAALELARLQEPVEDRVASNLVTRIGVHTGPMLVGNLGSAQRFDYTAIGDAVNLASRLEGLNKAFGTRAIVSQDTLERTDDGFVVRSLGRVRVVGRTEPVEIFELVGERGQPTRPDEQALEAFARAMADFTARRFREARLGLREVVAHCGGRDGPSEFYLRAADRFLAEPPPQDWDGVVIFESK